MTKLMNLLYNNIMPNDIDIETSKIKIGGKTIVSIIVAVITVTIAVATFGSSLATKEYINTALADSAPANIVPKVENCEKKIGKIEENLRHYGRQQQYILGRLDLLIERELIKAQSNPQIRQELTRAAKKVRKRQKTTNTHVKIKDPLKGINGL